MRACLIFCLLLTTFAAQAEKLDATDEAVRAAIRAAIPNASEMTISATPITGIREVAMGTQVIYASDDGRFLLGGPLLDSASGENLTDKRVAVARAALLRDPNLKTFTWPAANVAHTITVVTDIDCPYCRKLHKVIPELNAAGVSVEYVMLPRSGRNSPSYDKTVGAACEDDAEAAITAAMNGASFERATCANAVDQHMTMARALGVTSTPGIVLPSGDLVLGFKNAGDILALLEE